MRQDGAPQPGAPEASWQPPAPSPAARPPGSEIFDFDELDRMMPFEAACQEESLFDLSAASLVVSEDESLSAHGEDLDKIRDLATEKPLEPLMHLDAAGEGGRPGDPLSARSVCCEDEGQAEDLAGMPELTFVDDQCETESCATEDLWWDSPDEQDLSCGGLAEGLVRDLAKGLDSPPVGLPAGGDFATPPGALAPRSGPAPPGGPLPPSVAAVCGISKLSPELTPATTSQTVHFDMFSEGSDSDSDSSVTGSGRVRRPRCGPRFFSLCDSDGSEELGLESCGDDEYACDWTMSLSKVGEQRIATLPSPGL